MKQTGEVLEGHHRCKRVRRGAIRRQQRTRVRTLPGVPLQGRRPRRPQEVEALRRTAGRAELRRRILLVELPRRVHRRRLRVRRQGGCGDFSSVDQSASAEAGGLGEHPSYLDVIYSAMPSSPNTLAEAITLCNGNPACGYIQEIHSENSKLGALPTYEGSALLAGTGVMWVLFKTTLTENLSCESGEADEDAPDCFRKAKPSPRVRRRRRRRRHSATRRALKSLSSTSGPIHTAETTPAPGTIPKMNISGTRTMPPSSNRRSWQLAGRLHARPMRRSFRPTSARVDGDALRMPPARLHRGRVSGT